MFQRYFTDKTRTVGHSSTSPQKRRLSNQFLKTNLLSRLSSQGELGLSSKSRLRTEYNQSSPRHNGLSGDYQLKLRNIARSKEPQRVSSVKLGTGRGLRGSKGAEALKSLGGGGSIGSIGEFEKLLFVATKANDRVRIEALLSRGVEPEESLFPRSEPKGHTIGHYAVWHGVRGVIELLLRVGFDFDQSDIEGITPLMLACSRGNAPIVRMLCSLTRDINAQDVEGKTALHYAVERGNEQILEILLVHPGLDITRRCRAGRAPLDIASPELRNRLAPLLARRGSIGRIDPTLEPQLNLNFDFDVDINLEDGVDFRAEINGRPPPPAPPRPLRSNRALKLNPVSESKSHNETMRIFQTLEANPGDPSSSNSFKSSKPVMGPFAKKPLISRLPSGAGLPAPGLSESGRLFKTSNGFRTQPAKQTLLGPAKNRLFTGLPLRRYEVPRTISAPRPEGLGLHSFILHSVIGSGSFGDVYLVEKKDTPMRYFAMKVLDKSRVHKENLSRYVMTERKVLSLINHPFVTRLRFAFQNPGFLFLVMDYYPGGNLSECLEREGRLSESRAKLYIAEIVLSIQELHKNDIIYRDLKPENIVLDAEGHALLIDFGLSKEGISSVSRGTKSFCGSCAYLAPEMLKKRGHGKAIDWYLLGVVLYELLTGVPPFYSEHQDELFYNIENMSLVFPEHLSNDVVDLISSLMIRDPLYRLGGQKDAEELKSHCWFSDIDWDRLLQRQYKPERPKVKRLKLHQIQGKDLEFFSSEEQAKTNVVGWTFIDTPPSQNRL